MNNFLLVSKSVNVTVEKLRTNALVRRVKNKIKLPVSVIMVDQSLVIIFKGKNI